MNNNIFRVTIAVFVILLLAVVDVQALKPENRQMLDRNNSEDYIVQTNPSWELMKRPVKVKGIYMTGNTVGIDKRFNALINLIDKTELNAVVIDVKNDEGLMTYSTDLPDVKFAGANEKILIKDIDRVLKLLNEKNIYPIARIVCFKDKKAGNKFAQLAVKNKNGGIWRDRGGMTWLNPYNKESWDYILSIAKEAAIKGFREIQFDYVRFPTDGDLRSINYGVNTQENTKEKTIAGFLSYAHKHLTSMGVSVSADVFGLVTTSTDGMSIGQHLEIVAKSVDVICPMVYPSHYGRGSYGIDEPDFHPYKIVNHSMKTAKYRIDQLQWEGKKALLRPWLQDFTAKYLPKYKLYGPEEVRAQIKATYDAGLEEWILWNAGNNYTASALE